MEDVRPGTDASQQLQVQQRHAAGRRLLFDRDRPVGAGACKGAAWALPARAPGPRPAPSFALQIHAAAFSSLFHKIGPQGAIMSTLFYEPSTRTRLSFERQARHAKHTCWGGGLGGASGLLPVCRAGCNPAAGGCRWAAFWAPPHGSRCALFPPPTLLPLRPPRSAMARLGGTILTTESAAEFSSAAKGETLEGERGHCWVLLALLGCCLSLLPCSPRSSL